MLGQRQGIFTFFAKLDASLLRYPLGRGYRICDGVTRFGDPEIPRPLGDGPPVRIIEHPAHAPGHAALVIEERGVLVAGDMLSDVLVPMLDDWNTTNDPIEEYLVGLRLLEGVEDDVEVLVPGHGSVTGAEQIRARIEHDRAYLRACVTVPFPTIRGSAHRLSPAGSG